MYESEVGLVGGWLGVGVCLAWLGESVGWWWLDAGVVDGMVDVVDVVVVVVGWQVIGGWLADVTAAGTKGAEGCLDKVGGINYHEGIAACFLPSFNTGSHSPPPIQQTSFRPL